MKLISRLIIIAALFMSAKVMPAAESNPEKASFTFRVIAWDEVIDDLKFAAGEKKSVAMLMLPNGRSGFYNYQGPANQPLVFFREKQNEKGETLRVPAASIPLNQLLEHTLLMVYNTPGQPGHYGIMAMDDSPKTLAAGGYCFMNLSKSPLAIKCGEVNGIATAGQSLVLAGKPGDGGEITGVEIYAQEEGAKAPKRVYANRWPYDNKTRTNVFVFKNPTSGSFELKRIHEDASILAKHLEAAPKKPATPRP